MRSEAVIVRPAAGRRSVSRDPRRREGIPHSESGFGFVLQVNHTETNDLVAGVYASLIDENRSAEESNGVAHGNAFGVYGTWVHRSGWYVEGMMVYGNFDNSFSARYHGDPSHTMVNANDWNSSSGAIAMEVGRQFELADGWSKGRNLENTYRLNADYRYAF